MLRSHPRAPRARRQDAAEEAKLLREEMVQLFKQFRAAGGSKAMQDKLIRDFQSLNKKMLETTKQTRTPAPLPQARGRLALNCLLAAEDLMGQHPSTAGAGGGGMGAAIAGGDEASKPLLAEDNFEETQQQSRMQNNEDQIMQRDKAIQDIESTVADVAEIMQDLAVVVHSQDDLIDNIESAVDRTVDQTKAANTELVKVRAPARGCRPRLSDSRPASPSSGFLAQAEGYQKKSRKIVCCIFPILIIVVGAIIVRLVWFGDPK